MKILGKVTSIFGGSPKTSSTAAVEDITDSQNATKAARAALYNTDGGVNGQELDPNQVQRRPNLLGN